MQFNSSNLRYKKPRERKENISNIVLLTFFLISAISLSLISWCTPWDDEPVHITFYNASSASANAVEAFLDAQVATANNILENHNCTVKFPSLPQPKINNVPSLPNNWKTGDGPYDTDQYFTSYLSATQINVIVADSAQEYDGSVYNYVGGAFHLELDSNEDPVVYIVLPLSGSISRTLLHELGHRAGLSDNTVPNNIMNNTASGGTDLNSEQIWAYQTLFGLMP